MSVVPAMRNVTAVTVRLTVTAVTVLTVAIIYSEPMYEYYLFGTHMSY